MAPLIFPRKPRVQTKLKFEQLEKESSTEISLQDPVVNGDKVVSGGTKIYSQTNQTIVGLGYNEIEKLLDRERANAINARLEEEMKD